MVAINTVAVLGATGNLGPSILTALHTAGFRVTALARASSQHTNSTPQFPPHLEPHLAVRHVDYASFESIKEALQGQDAVVSVVGTGAIAVQRLFVDAAVAAGVRRFVPSEFGVNTRKVRGTPIGGVLKGKIAVVDYLEEVVAKGESELTWTGVATGLFFDWGLDRSGLGIVNLKDKTATVVDSGNEKFQASTLAQIGKAVAGILKHPDETANKYVSAESFTLSENELVALVEELTGSTLAVNHVKSEDLRKAGEEKLAVGDFRGFVDLLRVHNSADGAGNGLKEGESVNKVIELPDEDLRAAVESWLRREGAL